MNIKDILKETRDDFTKTIEFFQKDVSAIRTGRANPCLVENIIVDSYGSKMPLKQIASISVMGPRILAIQPWDVSAILSIEKAILQSNLGANPVVDKNIVRITLPSLTEEYRKTLSKSLSEKAEAARISLRKTREDKWRQIQDGFRVGSVREDDKFKGKDELQKLIDEFSNQVEEICQRKEKEIMES
jgi:ribosome recycling factor